MELEIGTRIGNYRLLHLCGKGAYGITYLAQSEIGGQRVVIKFVPECLFGTHFQRELEGLSVCCNLHHPHFLTIYHIDKIDNWIYYTMPPADNRLRGNEYAP